MSTVAKKRHFTVHEYLALESDSPTKHEFYRGEIFAMAGASIAHNVIAGNVFARLHVVLRGKKCRPFGSDQRISIQKVGLYTYPDISVVCGPLERDEQDPNAITNPRVLVEVLSKETENYDRGQKWEFYQQLDSLREYLLVSQEEPKAARYWRQDDGAWRYELVSGLDQTLQLESLGCAVPLAEIYEGVTLGLQAPPPAASPQPATSPPPASR